MAPKDKFLQSLVKKGGRRAYFALLIIGAEKAGALEILKSVKGGTVGG